MKAWRNIRRINRGNGAKCRRDEGMYAIHVMASPAAYDIVDNRIVDDFRTGNDDISPPVAESQSQAAGGLRFTQL